MLFFHLVDDYYLQGILASMKQKKWWEKNTSADMYKNDYIVALIEHAFSWTFMIHIPICFWYHSIMCTKVLLITFIFNWISHALIDHLKANLLAINLVQDQLFHVIQIFITWTLYLTMYR